METLAGLREVQRKAVRVQRRLWLIQVLMWPTLVLAAVTASIALVLWSRRSTGGGRHELPETPGVHRVDADNETSDTHLDPPH
jgi:hypothetical protein